MKYQTCFLQPSPSTAMQFSTSDEPIPGPTFSAHAEPTSKAMARSDITSVEAIVVKGLKHRAHVSLVSLLGFQPPLRINIPDCLVPWPNPLPILVVFML